MQTADRQRIFAVSTPTLRLLLGLTLIGVWWPIAWREIQPFSDYYFFPLWLGYILIVDGIVGLRTGTSPIVRAGWRVVWMFVASSALWWIFEAFNQIVDNWHYHTPVTYSKFEYFLLASLAFSTVIPAVLTTAELVRSLNWQPLGGLPRLRLTFGRLVAYHLFGWLIVLATTDSPKVFFPLVWFALIFLLDPLVTLLGGRSIARQVDERNWSGVFNVALAALVCGFFWEMWNIYALPKWTYDVPYADWLHMFEMPLLGFGGYLPFGVEVYVFYELCRALVGRERLPVALIEAPEAAHAPNPVLAAD